MKKIILFLFLVISYSIKSQSLTPEGIFPACINYNSAGYAQISWTLGDTQIATLKSNDKSVILTQGFLQPNFTFVGITPTKENDNFQCVVFPNPVKDILNIEFISKNNIGLNYYLYDLNGKILLSRKTYTTDKISQLNFTSLQSGYYILKVHSEDQLYQKSFKILFQK